MKQNPPRTHKEALQDMDGKLRLIRGLARNLAVREVPALAKATLPDSADRARLVAACASKPLTEVYPVLRGDASEVAQMLEEILITAACIARHVAELEELRLEPFKAMA